MKPIDALARRVQLIDSVQKDQAQKLKCAGREDEFPAHVLLSCADHGVKTLRGMQTTIQEGLAVQSAVLCRSFYETAIRCLWASREKAGWIRLAIFFADQERKWATGVKDLPGFGTFAGRVLREAKKVLGFKDPGGERYGLAPCIEQMLKDIEKANLSNGLVRPPGDDGAWQYNNEYRVLSHSSHGHLRVMESDEPNKIIFHATSCAFRGTLALLIAFSHVDPNPENGRLCLEAVAKEMTRLQRELDARQE